MGAAVSVIQQFAKSNAGAQLVLDDKTETRIAIKHGKRTIAYIGIGRDLWGQLMVDRFNCHEQLLTAARNLVKLLEDTGTESQWADGEETDRVFAWYEFEELRAAISKADQK